MGDVIGLPEGLTGVFAVHRRQRVELHAMFFERLQAGHHPGEGRLAALVHAVGVVQVGRAVDADADQKMLGGEKFAPFVIEQNAVGLEGVFNGLIPGMLRLEFDHGAEEAYAKQRGLAALPRKTDDRTRLRCDVVAHIGLKHLRFHPPAAGVSIEEFLFEIETVATVQIAARTNGLGEQMEGRPGGGRGGGAPLAGPPGGGGGGGGAPSCVATAWIRLEPSTRAASSAHAGCAV